MALPVLLLCAAGCSSSYRAESIQRVAYDGQTVTIEFAPNGPNVVLTKDATLQLHAQLAKLLDVVGPKPEPRPSRTSGQPPIL